MSTRQASLFGAQRLQMTESIELTLESLRAYGARYTHWAIAWSGGKDSSTLVTVVLWAILAGKVPPPSRLSVKYADTRLELLPLWLAARSIREELEDKAEALAALGCVLDVETVMAPLDKRFMVYLLGRGVPPPNNNTLRWCTEQIKIKPMEEALRQLATPGGEKVLMLTGVRHGESASRDGRIALACGKNGSECGQGWYHETLDDALCDTLAPVLWWRVCHVWEWLRGWAPRPEFGDWSTEIIAEAYGGDEAEEKNARTGCVGCPLAEKDTALDSLIAQERWAYLAPLKLLRPLWRELREPRNRLRKAGVELLKSGKIGKNPQRMGPLTLEARLGALGRVLDIQTKVNDEAWRLRRPFIDILNAEEEARIRELIAANTWPEKWNGDEPRGDAWMESIFEDGTSQPLLFPVEALEEL